MLTLVPPGLAFLGAMVPLVGSGFTVWGIALVWLAAAALVTVGRAIAHLEPPMRVFVDLVLLVMAGAVFFPEGGWWFVPAVLAQALLDWRTARQSASQIT